MNEPKQIPLSKGQFALVSPEDYEMVNRHKWYVSSNGYACRTLPCGTRLYLHRVINRTPDGMHTDHKDRNKLNCTRGNLRTANVSENARNHTKRCGGFTSQFKGVMFEAGKGKISKNPRWQAYIVDAKKQHYLGAYVTELDAALAYNIAARKIHGEFCVVNDLPLDYLTHHSEPVKFCDRIASRFSGVSIHKPTGLWVVRLRRNGKYVEHSYHKTEEAAALKWNEVALQHGVPESKLNQVYAA